MQTLAQLIAADSIQTLFQPIVDNKKQGILGYEALSRGPENSPYYTAPAIFALARQQSRLLELEVHCLVSAIRRFQERRLEGMLFVNLSPATLQTLSLPNFQKLLTQYDLQPIQLVIELTEQPEDSSLPALIERIVSLREAGIAIAIDDLGSASSSLSRWLTLKPEYIKLDRLFSHGLQDDPTRRLFINSLLELANQTNTRLICEGVETQEEWYTLVQLGLRYGQGFWFAKPLAYPEPLEIQSISQHAKHQQRQRIRELVQTAKTVLPTEQCQQVLELFKADANLHCLPVINQKDQPIGVIRRNMLMAHFAERFGHSLYAKRPVRDLMDPNPICVDANLDLIQVSQHLVEHNSDDMDAWFLICEQGQYLGMGRIRELMHKLTNFKIQMAQHANPLTLLPGNVPIHQNIEKAVQLNEAFILVYCDLNHFKPYNDVYGYDRGDQIIKLIAQLLRKHLGHKNNFIGHLGGDDFILLLKQGDWQTGIRGLQNELRQRRLQYYQAQDVDAGGIHSLDRDGQQKFFPLLEMAVGLVPWQPGCGLTAGQLSEQLTLAKKAAKLHPHLDYWLEQKPELACTA